MVDATISFAIEKLGDFIAQEVSIRIGVKDGVRWLKDELVYLQSAVRSAELRQDEEQICNWVNNVRDVAHDAVTILRDFNALQQEQAAVKQGVLDCFRGCVCMYKKEVKLYDIGKDIESLKERIVVIKNRRIEYGIDNILSTPNVQKKQRTLLRTTAILHQVDVVGFKDDFKTLMAELDSEDPSLKVISIHGMGGLGKTSLATKLFNSGELRYFDTRAKVCVSNEYNIIDVLKRIIKSFKGLEHEQYISNMDEHDSLQYLSKLLQCGGRYFALIDDIWDIKAWEQIKIAFPNQKNGSRIIITTRNKIIAQAVEDKCFVHQLRFLREDESWQLFCKRVEPTSLNMEKLGREMVGKCGGLPLAIVVLSGLLVHNMSYEYWLKVKEHIWRHLKEGGSFQIQEVLSLSYSDLSPQMRDCFLYLAKYPEDHVFYPRELKLPWIAEEFISEADEGEGLVLEDLAEDYLNELIDRNLIQVESLQLNGQALTCRVHDLVRELAINIAKDHKLLAVFDLSKHHPNQIQLLEGRLRHVIYNGFGVYLNLLEPKFDALHLHSLTLDNYIGLVELKEMKLMYTMFKNLKVLDMTSVVSDRIPEEIGELVFLKFLGLVGCEKLSQILVIPPSIGKLRRLQTLKGMNYKHYTLPREICELHELRYLDIEISGSLNIGSHQTKLHTLSWIHYKHLLQIDVVNISNLCTLYIHIEEEEYSYSMEFIPSLTSLKTFSIYSPFNSIPTTKPLSTCNRLESVTLFGPMEDPSGLIFLPDSVMDLTLAGSEFREDQMRTLGNLSNLTALELDEVYEGDRIGCNHKAFPSLQILRLRHMHYLEELQVEDGALPSLKSFQTTQCGRLKKIPAPLERLWIKDE
ncbi:putative disease resistance RPP13-like protein 3 [Daucus carota subsp. sativus]|uniref:NB-ARC domain-containing protein n=1 Tax=Daucus carota subsp. sativus TaxID=79200 RepID=A0A175YF75_DAUCS|nr:PREDICTED: putative disease resistance RPP13-like protein 3 [Daucus carota subsp. sativus]